MRQEVRHLTFGRFAVIMDLQFAGQAKAGVLIKLNTKKLKESLNNDQRIIRLNELEKKMDENEEVMALAYKKDMASIEYSDALNHYPENSEEVQKALQKLHESKLNLDNHPLVKEYLVAYKEVRELYAKINEILFSNFAAELCPKEK